ncbi:cardiolipin synthase [Salidesulfovibrio brasiliensis]|uniref:cardiolipin synthase n=1 Tax=Salidesulfovibrio brasiliensis TaxID=221711 RepID=UPI000A42831A|nr:cardiolipin synthase [Salidesulfovibrio brasiliensis]
MESSMLLILAGLFWTTVEVLGIWTAIRAVRDTRTSQGAIAWALFLVTTPLVGVPLYWVFGRSKFNGYVEAMRVAREEYDRISDGRNQLPTPATPFEREDADHARCVFEHLAGLPFLPDNDLELLVDGQITFGAIFDAIRQAESYVLIQFFIVHDDRLGNRLKNLLIEKASQGLTIRFLYDEVGCRKTPSSYWKSLREAGVHVYPFLSTRGRGNRFQLNFRNHRKIVIVDGHTSFVGGHNVGDEYVGQDRRFGHWRDTHIRCSGPAVLGVELNYAKDWYWATGTVLDMTWVIPGPRGTAGALALGTGPADPVESCSLMFVRAINAARERIWIASPYFVPDSSVIKALQLAALRGVDVRILIPQKPDHKVVWLAGFAALKDLHMDNIRVYRYRRGFLHQKVFLCDDFLCGVGTANLDNRSFRLNFEITMLVEDKGFCGQIREMFEKDFTDCIETGPDEYDRTSTPFKVLVKIARLLSPIL